jgi:peptidyl-prolyl cis-trans isomerase SurA
MARLKGNVATDLMLLCVFIRHLAVATATLAAAAAWLVQPLGQGPLAAQTASPQKAARASAPKTAKEGNESAPRSAGEQAILVLVNDEPITAYQVEQRARFLALNANLGEQVKDNFQRLAKSESVNARFKAVQEEVLRANQGKTREQIIAILQERQKEFAMSLQKQALESARAGVLPRLKKDAKEELIEERLKLQEARKLGIQVSDEDVKTMLTGLGERNKMTYDQFSKHIKSMGVDIATLGERMRAQRAWRDLIGRRYGAQVAVTQTDIDRVLASSAAEAGEDTLELQVGKITLGLSSTGDQTGLTKRFADAEALRRKFTGCRSLSELAKAVPGAKVDELRYIKPSAVQEPTRTMLLSAKDGDMLPPATTSAGVEVYAVCARRTVAGNEAQRAKTQEDLQYKQLDMFAQRHMRNLRQDAHIEYR